MFAVLLAVGPATAAAESTLTPEAIVAHYCAVTRDLQQSLNGSTMQVEISASIPKLKKRGRLFGLRHISRLGRITYDALRYEGDNTVKNNVIGRYLTAEVQSQAESPAALAVTPDNYKFKYKREMEFDGRTVHVFHVAPRRKRVGLFKGEVWIDAATYLRVQEAGRFVKSPSVFLKKIDFVRKYEIRDGLSYPRRIESVANTWLVGPAQLTIDFSNVSFGGASERAGLAEGDEQ